MLKAALGEFSTDEILFLLAHLKKTGRLSLKISPDKEGSIYINEGSAVHSTYNKFKGTEALYFLSLWKDGEIEFIAGETTKERSIKESSYEILEEIERKKSEMKEYEEKLPPFDTVLMRTPQPPSSSINLRRSDWALLTLVNGEKSIEEIVEESKVGILDVCKGLSWLLKKELVFDPKETGRIFREKVRFLNIFICEFGKKGMTVSDWKEKTQQKLTSIDNQKILNRYLIFESDKVIVGAVDEKELAKGYILRVFEELFEKLYEDAKKEFGVALAKHKYKTVVEKFSKK